MNSERDHSSFIHDLQIASPCKADWDTMTGDEQKRFCAACKLNVYNISAMTLPEAEELISKSEGRVCVRMYRRKDGTVITQDCPVGVAAKLRRRIGQSVAACAAVVAVIGTWIITYREPGRPSLWQQLTTACSPLSPMQGSVAPAHTMGEVAYPVQAEQGKVAR